MHVKLPPKKTGPLSWQLAAFIALIMFVLSLGWIDQQLPQLLKAFGGRETTGYVYSKHYTSGKFSKNILEIGYHDQEDKPQFAYVNVDASTYKAYPETDPLADKKPIQIVYNPNNHDQIYALTGQSNPDWLDFLMITFIVLIIPSVIARYKKVLYRKVF